jgi:hypothetical protein
MDDDQLVARAIKRLEHQDAVKNPPYLPKPTRQLAAPFDEMGLNS